MSSSQNYTTALDQLGSSAVSIFEYQYLVDFGPAVQFRFHLVDREKHCTCGLGASCPAVLAVIEYLDEGGVEPPELPDGYFPLAPRECPVCGAPAYFDNQLCSRKRGAGWKCSQGGIGHYWRYHFSVLAERIKANPWLFPPVTAPDGTLLYPGVLRVDVITTSDPAA